MRVSLFHKILVYSFLVSFVYNILLPSFILVEFKVNQEFIAANLCVDKDIKESSCKGKCQLKKSLAKVEKANEKRNDFVENIESHITSLFIEETQKYLFASKIFNNKKPSIYHNSVSSGFEKSLFRPPISC